MYEKDVEKMFDWIRNNHELFMLKYTKIGRSSSETKELQDEHDYFYIGSLNVQVNVKRLEEVSSRLLVSGHYASARISSLSSKLVSYLEGVHFMFGGKDDHTIHGIYILPEFRKCSFDPFLLGHRILN